MPGYKEALDNFKPVDLKAMRPAGFFRASEGRNREHYRRVERGHGWKTVSRCPVCRSRRMRTELVKMKVRVARCLDCSLVYNTRVPADTADIYSDDRYLPLCRDRYMKNSAYRRRRFAEERVGLIREHAGRLRGKRLLDVGCGTGWFLEVAKRHGLDVSGTEMAGSMAAWTARRLGIRVYDCDLKDIPDRFDIITMFDVIEHSTDPAGLVLDCKKVLRRGGFMLVFTPNIDSLAYYVMKKDWNHIIPTDHPVCFNESSTRALAGRTGMRLAYLRTCGIDLGDLKSYYEWLRRDDLASACEKAYDHVQPLVDAAGAGDHMRFILRKR